MAIPRRLPVGSANLWMATLVLALLVLSNGPVEAKKSRYAEGEKIRFTGVVTDPSGFPLTDIHVVLEASNKKFRWLQLKRTSENLTRLTSRTNERGEFEIEWPWQGSLNHFELAMGVPIRRSDGQVLKVLERVDLSDKVRQGSPVVTAAVIQEAAFVANLRQFLATIQSTDQRRIHEEMGEPDNVEQVVIGTKQEVAWWYFEAGKVYRFDEGNLQRIEPFDPVKPFAENSP